MLPAGMPSAAVKWLLASWLYPVLDVIPASSFKQHHSSASFHSSIISSLAWRVFSMYLTTHRPLFQLMSLL
jgi:hypothetical protein